MSRFIDLKAKKGLSIVEAMLAVAVLMIGVSAAMNIFPTALKISRNAEQETIAANLAQAEIESMFQLGYDNIPLGTIEARHRLSSDSSNPFYNFERQTVSAYVDSDLNETASNAGIIKITTTVYWKAPQFNIEKSMPISVIISQN